jgi:hypothetical protein
MTKIRGSGYTDHLNRHPAENICHAFDYAAYLGRPLNNHITINFGSPDHSGTIFRAIVGFRDGDDVQLQSNKQKSLNRFFPEVVAGLARLTPDRFVLDGEPIIPGQAFETLQLRLHPAATRATRLAKESPARLVVFACWLLAAAS